MELVSFEDAYGRNAELSLRILTFSLTVLSKALLNSRICPVDNEELLQASRCGKGVLGERLESNRYRPWQRL